ncbi:MAG: M28 family peptidase [Prosthecobacter sp.]|uniref:M28 family peptidase n=1 Tax=Prosthecobacter sp. TaxID=1965333 RepID=UPI00390269E8
MSLSLFVLAALYGAVRYSGPGLVPNGSDVVSAAGALETLDMLLGEEQKTHAAGSKENEHVRVRLLGALNELSAQTWQLPLAENEDEERSQKGMVNIVARIEGKPRVRPVMLVTHYDSCPHGPGAGDAGQCVAAILEVLRVLKNKPLEYELWCVFTDAEELGLVGAADLMERSEFPWGQETPLVLNFDARGDRGAVLLYETHENNLHAMRVAAKALASPVVSTSLMVNIYQRLPNGTDFTVFQKKGCPGWNFAVIGGAERYHTPDDSMDHLSPRSVQHFASHGMSFVRRLDRLSADELKSIERSEPAVFFDIFGFGLVVYPAYWNWVHLCVVTAIWMTGWFLVRSRSNWLKCTLVFGVIFAALLASGLTGWAIAGGMAASEMLPRRFVEYYEYYCLFFVAAAIMIVMVLGRTLSTVCSRAEILIGLIGALLLIGCTACQRLPGGAYLLLWSSAVLAVLLIFESPLFDAKRISAKWASLHDNLGLIGCIVPAILYGPTYVLLARAMGPHASVLLTVAITLMLLPTIVVCRMSPPPTKQRRGPFYTVVSPDRLGVSYVAGRL